MGLETAWTKPFRVFCLKTMFLETYWANNHFAWNSLDQWRK